MAVCPPPGGETTPEDSLVSHGGVLSQLEDQTGIITELFFFFSDHHNPFSLTFSLTYFILSLSSHISSQGQQ